MKLARASLLLVLFILFVTSCACTNPVEEDQFIYVRFMSEGTAIREYKMSPNSKFVLPESPVRTGYKFNGWWVTCEEGVVEYNRKWLQQQQPCKQTIEVNARWLNTSYSMEQLAWGTPATIQDGTFFNGLLFKFDSSGLCYVFDTSNGRKIGGFMLDKVDDFKPHANSVCFSSTYYENGDEFPLLYVNLYNNYKNSVDKRAGMVCVYRIQRTSETTFKSTLVQTIRVDFADDEPWRSKWDSESEAYVDRSPWGNFIVDTDKNQLWVFVTRDDNLTTRYFCFDLPAVSTDKRSDIRLKKTDVKRFFDVPYAWYLQGACYHDGKIYSTEGMGTDENPTRIRIIDLKHGIEDSVLDLYEDYDYMREAELIGFNGTECWYGDYRKINSNPTAYLYKISGI